jgi:hypothetical protein
MAGMAEQSTTNREPSLWTGRLAKSSVLVLIASAVVLPFVGPQHFLFMLLFGTAQVLAWLTYEFHKRSQAKEAVEVVAPNDLAD